MAFNTRYRSTGSSYYGYLPPGVKWLLIANVSLFILYVLAYNAGVGEHFRIFALWPRGIVEYFFIWQFATYMFLHSPMDLWHILFNMLSLWMFGSDLERTWGTRRFLTFYLVCGIGAGLCDFLVRVSSGSLDARTIGASGAVFGLLLAFGMLFPDRIIIFFIFPIKAKYLVMILGGVEVFNSMRGSTGVSNIAHLGGMLTGFLYLKFRVGAVDLGAPRRHYNQWKLQRAKKKFQVYLRKHGSDRDRWVN